MTPNEIRARVITHQIELAIKEFQKDEYAQIVLTEYDIIENYILMLLEGKI